MKRPVSAIAFVLGFVALPLVASAEESFETIEKKIAERWSKLKSLTADMEVDRNMQGSMDHVGGKVEYVRKGDKELWHQSYKAQMQLGELIVPLSLETVCDGEFLYSVHEMQDNKQAFKQKPDAIQQIPGGKYFFGQITPSSDIKYVGEEQLDGKDVWVLEAQSREPVMAGLSSSKLYFLKEHGILAKMIGMDAAGDTVMIVTFSNLKINEDIPADHFVFKAPEGVEVQDVTRLTPTIPRKGAEPVGGKKAPSP